MKRSQKIMLITIGMLAVLTIAALAIGRLGFIGGANRPRGPMVSETFDLEGFNGVVIDGLWKVSIAQSGSFTVEVDYPQQEKSNLDVRIGGFDLILGNKKKTVMGQKSYEARIGMPSIVSIEATGAGDLIISGFNEQSIAITVDGLARIQAEKSSAEYLDVFLDGLGEIDLSDLSAVNANVHLDGAGTILLNMNGGVLQGNLSGLGSISYRGNVSREDIDKEGFGEVIRKN